MLEPREADIPALFLILVVLPLVAYILLGKWSVYAKKRERISLLAQLAAEEGLRSQAMAIPDVIPIVSSPNNGLRACARCFNPATTRCSRCKSVRYCSGKCQIIHWREVHKQECQQLETVSSSSSPETFSVNGSVNEILFFSDSISSQYFGCNIKQNMVEQAPLDYMMYSSARTGFPDTVDSLVTDASQVSMLDRKTEKCASRKLRRKGGIASNTSAGACGSRAMYSTLSGSIPSKEDFVACKLRLSDPSALDELTPEKHDVNISDGYIDGEATSSTTMHETYRYQRQHTNVLEPRNHCGFPCSSQSTKCGTSELENGMSLVHNRGHFLKGESITSDEMIEPNSELTALKGGTKAKRAPYSHTNKISKLPKSSLKETEETHCSEREKGQVAEERKFLSFGDSAIEASNEVANPRMLKMMGLRKPTKLSRQDPQIISSGRHKIKMLFPYEEFVKFFLCEVLDLSPRGLLNCGNSCYANAVLQCLTCTKPLTIYLLRKTHSRSLGCGKDWCLICELEKHVIMLKENEGPLSPSRILSHLQSINCHIGDGNQEDAHEFLRLLVASMQSICLEGLGEENKVDPRLQETTFIQHTFGGNLRSKVKCLSCHNESERYENILDLTLEIFGWVESLEDALTQFTTPEDLDGENMYRCGRCAAYVRARKQLSIHEAPNILTIVLKRFQEGRYGKINKCITFPDMLDMIPFMTGTGDIPPLYILYAVVVHLDTLNASFSGHYVSYVKDMQGNWFKIDDAEVQPVSLSQVMSEGAYMLFYTRSSPRPQSTLPGRATRHQVPDSTSYCSTSRAQKPYRPVQKKSSSQFVIQEPHLDDTRVDITNGFANHTSNDTLRRENRNVVSTYETYNEPIRLMEFSDATSSDWSLFTSSDEASFTTDSARDSFSTVDYGDTCNIEPISSIFHAMYAPEYSHSSFPSRKISNSRPHSRFVCQERPSKGDFSQQSSSATEFSSDSNSGMFERYGSNPIHGFDQTYDPCKL